MVSTARRKRIPRPLAPRGAAGNDAAGVVQAKRLRHLGQRGGRPTTCQPRRHMAAIVAAAPILERGRRAPVVLGHRSQHRFRRHMRQPTRRRNVVLLMRTLHPLTHRVHKGLTAQ